MIASKDYELKCCPVCGSDTLEEVLIDKYNHVVGCNDCWMRKMRLQNCGKQSPAIKQPSQQSET